MISVEAALEHLFELVVPTDIETVPLDRACGRVLAKSVAAHRDQPPFSASAMDGYAISEQVISTGLEFKIIGESAAGHRFMPDKLYVFLLGRRFPKMQTVLSFKKM